LVLVGAAPASAGAQTPSRLIVSARAGVAAAAAAVERVGGHVLDRLPLLGAVVADVPTGVRLPDGISSAPDRKVTLRSAATDGGGAASTVRATLGLAAAGNEGAGVTVAVVDTGVADVADLAGAVDHVDVTGTGVGDGYGHGTFMAGLIAGSGASSGGRFLGVAPAARILDVRVADSQGNTSLITVLRGLEVVARHPEVRIVNLSLSSESPLPYQADPLTRALDALWARGVVVVVPAGNDGPLAGTISSPGTDPNLLTVGGIDENATAARADDAIAAWSSRGPAPQGVAKPDLAAPGAHLVSLRAPGSAIDAANEAARVGDSYFIGSGTSMATAVTSGSVAALLAARPGLRPADVKALLTGTAYAAGGLGDGSAAGAGGLDVRTALTAAVPDAAKAAHGKKADLPTWMTDDAAAFELFARAWSAGDYDATARAWSQLSPQARAWSARAWSMEVWASAAALSDAEWQARAWSARAWSARAWSGTDWLARAWSARAWSDADWAARAWSARAWSAQSWTARSWSARSWSDADWTDAEWSARAWSARAWSARSWSARSWSAITWS
ncbi:MAG: serine protease AprX, partial [Frankiaceae bacterium]|nr:serine protease AprX [Frankiaceae bacterium]